MREVASSAEQHLLGEVDRLPVAEDRLGVNLSGPVEPRADQPRPARAATVDVGGGEHGNVVRGAEGATSRRAPRR